MKKETLVLLLSTLSIILFRCKAEHFNHPTVKIETIFGDIYVEVYPEKAPLSAGTFLANVEQGVYKKSNFYRVLKAEDQPSSAAKSNLIQGGIYLSNPNLLRQKKPIALETTEQTGLKHEDGTMSFARSTPNSGGVEFFICIGKLPAYDFGGDANADHQGFAAFGKVIRGMDVVRKIHSQPSDETSFTPPLRIDDIIYLNPPGK